MKRAAARCVISASLVLSAFAQQAPPDPVLLINYPSRLSTRYVNISPYGFESHRFTVVDHGLTTQPSGVRLERFLETAGWRYRPLDNPPHYAVEVSGSQSTVTLDSLGRGWFEQQAWLVSRIGPDSKPEVSLFVVREDGILVERVDGIRKIRVSEPAGASLDK